MNLLSLKSGTDIRGVASEGEKDQPITLTNEVVKSIASGFLVFCEKRLNKSADTMKIALGHDSRISAERISHCIKDTFTKYGVEVLDCGLASTPSMFMAVIDVPCDCSVQITASHHPYNRNGLKFFTKDGGLDSPDISEILENAQQKKTPNTETAGKVISSDFMKRYAEILRNKIKESVSAEDYDLPLKNFKIVVDAGNGAGGFYAYDVLAPLGADVSGSVFLEPDGMFPNHVPNPENSDAMKAVSDATVHTGADIGVIFDTDVDRGAAVDQNGIEISRNKLVALSAAIALENEPGGVIVTDSVTSDGLKEYIENTLGGVHHRFKRGYKNVINEAVRLNKEGANCPLAIETSGHAAMRENYFLDDGAYLVTKIIIKMALLKKEGKNLEDLLRPLKEAVEAKEIRYSISDPDFHTYGENVLQKLEAYAISKNWDIAPDNREGLRISFPESDGNGWFLLRLSVHDPIMPLNLESNSIGGTELLLSHVTTFFKNHHFFDE